MSDPIQPVRPVKSERRRSTRRHGDPPAQAAAASPAFHLPVVIAQPEPSGTADGGPAIFAAQLMGQSGQKRGLRGGAPVLEAARSAYLGAEWSGGNDRRPRRGTAAKTEI